MTLRLLPFLFSSALLIGQQGRFIPTNHYPFDGATDIPLNASISHAGIGNPIYRTALRDPAGAVPLELIATGTVFEYRLRPARPLTPNTRYSVEITATVSTFQPYSFSFTTGTRTDTEGPRLVSMSPEPGSTLPGHSDPIRVRFTEPMLGAGGGRLDFGWSIESYPFIDGSANPIFSLSEDRREILILPQAGARVIDITANPAALMDPAGNRGTGEVQRFRFFRGLPADSVSPAVIGSYPAAGETPIAPNSPIQLLFDRPMFTQLLLSNPASAPIRVTAAGTRMPVRLDRFAGGRGLLILPANGSWPVNSSLELHMDPTLHDVAGVPMRSAFDLTLRTNAEILSPSTPVIETQAPSQPNTFSQTAVFPNNSQIQIRTTHPWPEIVTQYAANITPQPDLPAFSARLSQDKRTLILSPNGPLPAGAIVVAFPAPRDILGREVQPFFDIRVSPASELEPLPPPESTPLDGEAAAPLSIEPRLRLALPLSLEQPDDALRLMAGSEAVAGRVVIERQVLRFRPLRPLAPETEYRLEYGALRTIVGSSIEPGAFRFTTGPANPPPRPFQQAQFSPAPGRGDLSIDQSIRIDFGRPAGAADMNCTATAIGAVPIAPSPSAALRIRQSWEGQTLIVAPVDGWPSTNTFGISCFGLDLQNQQLSASAVFAARVADAREPVRLLSVNPPPESTPPSRSRITLTFSRPVLDTSEFRRGLVWLGAVSPTPAELLWSPDRLSAVTEIPAGREDLTLVPTEALTDFAGNPVPHFAYRYKTGESSPERQSVLQMYPPRDSRDVDPSVSITVILSGIVPLDRFRRAIAVVDLQSGLRIEGRWEPATSEANSTALTFVPSAPLPFSATIRMLDYDDLLGASLQFFQFRVASAPEPPSTSSAIFVTRATSEAVPANGVIDIEFSREIPFRPDFVRLDYSTPNGFRFEEVELSQPRPRVVRLKAAPGAKWTTGNHRLLVDRAFASNLSSSGGLAFWPLVIGPEETATRPNLLAVAPAPDSVDVPVTAGLSLVFEDLINPLTLGEDSATVRVNGAAVRSAASLSFTRQGVRVSIGPSLPKNAAIEVEIAGLEDRFGRQFPAQRWSFRTGELFDTVAPALLSYTIHRSNNSEAPPVINPTQPVRIEFDEPIDPNSVQAGTGQSWRLSPDLRTLTFTPVPEWPRGRPSRISFPVLDLSGNRVGANSGPIEVLFSAVFEDDTTPPVLLEQSFPDGDTGVPLNPYFSLRFDSPVDHGSYRNFKLLQGATEIPLRTSARVFTLGNVLRFTPAALLEPNTEYTLVIQGASDPSGNEMAGTRRWTLTTGSHADIAPPTAPVSPAPSVAPGMPHFSWRFSEPIDATLAAVGRLIEGPDSGTNNNFTRALRARFELSADRKEFVIIPEEPLVEGYRYSIIVPPLYDRAGNARNQGNTLQLSVTPNTPIALEPLRVSFFPPNGTPNFPRNGIAAVVTSRGVSSYTLRVLEDGKPIDALVNRLTRTLSHPNGLWTAGSTYQVDIPGLQDGSGSRSVPFASTFTVGPSSDNSLVRYLSSEPTSGSRDIPPDARVRVLFDKPLHPTGVLGDAVLFTGPAALRIVVAPLRVDGSAIVATPAPYWPPASSVAGTINRFTQAQTGIRSWTGASMDFTPASFQFFTAALADSIPPSIESINPPPGSILPAIETFITIRFSEPVVIPADGFSVFVDGRASGGCFFSSTDNRTCRVQLKPPANVSISIVGTNAIKDYAGNSLTPFVYDYTSSDVVAAGPIRMVRTEPARASTVAANAMPLVEFDRGMDLANIRAGFRVLRNNALVPGTVEELNAGRVFRFRPSEPFPAGSRILVILDRDVIRDSKGWGIYEETYFEFNISNSTAPLTIRRTNALPGASSSEPIEVEFETPLDPHSIDANSIWLSLDGRAVEGSVSLRGERIVRFDPASPLFVGQRYVLTLGSALQGRAGERWTGGYSLSFEAEADRQVTVASMTPTFWNGAPATMLRLSSRASAIDAAEFEAEGVETIIAADGRSVIVVTADAASIRLRGERVRVGSNVRRGKR